MKDTPTTSSQETTPSPKDIITLTTYSLDEKWMSGNGVKDIEDMIRGEIKKVKIMQESFEKSAENLKRNPPTFELYALMIPNWANKGEVVSYDEPEYHARKNAYIEKIKEICAAEKVKINIKDFYQDVASEDERKFLHTCEARGSCADLMKNRSIINHIPDRHLNVDTNTIINDFDAFYKATFASQEQKDGLNAVFYDSNYVSTHNKIVYTKPGSEFAQKLKEKHESYLSEAKDNDEHKTPKMNTLYSMPFCTAAMELDFSVRNRAYYQDWDNLWTYYSANVENSVYDMSKFVASAINMSWSQQDGKVEYGDLKKLKLNFKPHGQDQDLEIDFAAISYIIKKRTNMLLPEESREALEKVSNIELENECLNKFFEQLITSSDVKTISQFMNSIPENPLGKKLSEQLFAGITRENFAELTSRTSESLKDPVKNNLTPSDIAKLSNFIPFEKSEEFQKAALEEQKKCFTDNPEYKNFEKIINEELEKHKQDPNISEELSKLLTVEMEKLKFITAQDLVDSLTEGKTTSLTRRIDNIKFKSESRDEINQLSKQASQKLNNTLYKDEKDFKKALRKEIARNSFYNDPTISEAISSLNKQLKSYDNSPKAEEEIGDIFKALQSSLANYIEDSASSTPSKIFLDQQADIKRLKTPPVEQVVPLRRSKSFSEKTSHVERVALRPRSKSFVELVVSSKANNLTNSRE